MPLSLQVSGVWDHKDDECRELMKAKWTRQGLKVTPAHSHPHTP